MAKQPSFGSLFAGAGGFDMGFDAAGFACAWQVEIDGTARDVLARHWPDVPRHPDVRGVGKKTLARVDVVVGGFPCQDVSTAGKRGGFEGGVRSSLWYEMLRVIDELRPAYVCWENVPGLLSADDGRAFGWVLRGLADLGFDGAWRTCDAQFFGVPQQRRRVFGVFARGRSGAERCAEILALAEGVRRRTSKGRKAGAGSAAAAAGGAGGGLRASDDLNQHDTGHRAAKLRPGALACGHLVFGGGDCRGEPLAAAAITTKGARQDFDTDNFVLMPGGVGCLAPDATPKGRVDGLAYTLTGGATRGHGNGMAVCVTVPVTPTLPAQVGTEDGTGRGTPVVAFAQNQRIDVPHLAPPPAVTCGGGKPGVQIGPVVRRLTPRECERLMGWGDDWTRWRADGREIADRPRYRLCGNGVVGTVSRWIAGRVATVMGAA